MPNRSLCLMQVWNLLEVSRGSAGATLGTTTNDKPFAEFRALLLRGWKIGRHRRSTKSGTRQSQVRRSQSTCLDRETARAGVRPDVESLECLSHLAPRDPAAWPRVVPDATCADLPPNNDSSFSSIILRNRSNTCETMPGQSPFVSELFTSISFLLTNS